MINVAVLGYGTVGSGVVEVIEKNKDMVNKKVRTGTGSEIHSGSERFPRRPL